MAAQYTTFGSYVLFKETLSCELGHLYRAGRLGKNALEGTVWLLVFDGDSMPASELAGAASKVEQIATVLKAGNVATGVRLDVVNGVPALAWDYLPGRPLAEVFARVQEEGFPIPVDNALLILEKLALALSAALAVDVGGSNLVHGFLHPALVTVTNDGEAVVAGLGLGDALLESLDDETVRRRCAPYLAPEVLTSRAPTPRADVYSLGAILYQLMTGSPLPADPAERAETVSAARLAYEDEPVPQDIMAVLSRSLAERPEERFSSAADFKKELDKLLYGGAYSPTTFNLALFMDRLFRNDIEIEEKERLEEKSLDVTPYLRPEPEPVVMPLNDEIETSPASGSGGGRGKGLWIAVGAVVVVAIAAGAFFFAGRSSGPPAVPTPTAEQLAAQKEAQQKQVEALVQQQVAELMQQREDEIRKELMNRQVEIDKLQKQLQQVQKSSRSKAQAKKEQERIQKQIAAAKEAKRKQEEALAEERRKAEEKARQALAATPTPTAAMRAPTPVPTRAAPPTPQGVQRNQFVPATEVDTRPVVLRQEPVVWPRSAVRSRRHGVIILSVTVDARGTVTGVKILRADEKGFGIPEAATAAARKYIFKPATKDGVKVTSTATVTIPYAFKPQP
ncbi:MAG: TonB family protein [Acidobacteria bacterium]|nr:TonB family protein [Acidobacteriota bacterium]